ncbi:hypothetical protein Tco_0472974 [Tanacetum coccineum]
MPCQSFEHLVNERQQKVVILSFFIEFSIIDTDAPSDDRSLRHTQGALAAPLVPTLVVQLLRALTNSSKLSTLVVRLDLASGKMKPPEFLPGDGFISDSQTQLSLVNINYGASSGEESSEIPNREKRECGIRLILAPKLTKAFFTAKGPIRHGSVKLLGSPSFWGKLLE